MEVMTTHSSFRSSLPATALASARESARRHDGRFGTQARSEADLDLGYPVLGAEHVEAQLPAASREDATEIAEKVSAGLDFRPATIRQVADEHYLATYGVSYDDHEHALGHLEATDPATMDYVATLMARARRSTAATADEQGSVAPIASAPSRQANQPVRPGQTGVPARTRYHADSDFVQRGGVADTVISSDGTEYHRIRPSVYPGEFYSVRMQFNRKITQEEAERVSQLTGYSWRSSGGREEVGQPVFDSDYAVTMSVDSTKGKSDSYTFQKKLEEFINEGTPVRKTDQSGIGTKGTRLVDGIGDDDLQWELYADHVYVDDSEQAYNAAVEMEEHPAAGRTQ